MKIKNLQRNFEKIRAFFVDLDGTLLDEKEDETKVPSEVNLAAVYEIQKQKGKHVIVSTGKTWTDAKVYSEYLGSPYTISSNGAQVHDSKGKALRDVPIQPEDVKQLIEIAKSRKIAIGVSQEKKLYGVNTMMVKWISELYNLEPHKHYEIICNGKQYKMYLIGTKSKIKKLYNELVEKMKNAHIVHHSRMIEITHKNATKGKANDFVRKLLKLKKEETAHIGDSSNDVSTKEYMGTLIAMSNSTNSLLEHATHIGPYYKDHGVAQILCGNYYRLGKK